MKINIYIALILLLLLFFVIPTVCLLVFKENKKVLKILGIISFIFYLVAIFMLVFGKVSMKSNYVEIELVSNNKWFSLNFIISSLSLRNILYNLVMFIPIPAFVFTVAERHVFLKTILLAVGISFFIELMQFILPVSRTTELFDIITNTISAILGYIYFSFIVKSSKK